jgi:hypothetical protein
MMKHCSARFIAKAAFAVFFTFLLSSSALAFVTGTVTTKDSTVYENVTFTINETYKVIEFKADGVKKALSFTDIAKIVDPNGEDITMAVIGGYHKVEKNEAFLSENDEAYQYARRKLWNAGFSLGGNFTFAAGDYYTDLNPGIGFDADLAIALTYSLALRFSVSYAGMDYDDDLADVKEFGPGEALVSENYDFSSMSYFLSFQYYHRPDRVTPGKMIYHFYTGLGAVTHHLESDEVYILDYVEVFRQTVSYNETKFAQTIGGGFTRMLGESIGFYVAGNMDIVYLGRDPYDDIAYGFQFDLKVGLTLFTK